MVDVTHLRSWRDSWEGLHVTVIGLDDVGFAVCDTLQELGARVTVVAEDPTSDHAAIVGVLGVQVREMDDLPDSPGDLIIISPSGEASTWNRAFCEGVPVWSDVEFASRVSDKRGVAPTVVLVAGGGDQVGIARMAVEFLRRAGLHTFWGGFQAGVVLDALRDPEGWDVVVWVVNPSQVDRLGREVDTARAPQVVVCVDDEWDVTVEVLSELFRNTQTYCVYRRGGNLTERAVEAAEVIEGARAIGIGLDSPPVSDLGIVDGVVCDRAFLDDRRHTALELTTLEELAACGLSSAADVFAVLTASAIARSQGVDPETIGAVIASWADLEFTD